MHRIAGWLTTALAIAALYVSTAYTKAGAVEPPKALTEKDREALEEKVHDFTQRAVQFYQQGKYAEAAALQQRAAALCRTLYADESDAFGRRNLARVVGSLGAFLEAAGDYEKAESCYREVLDIHRRLFPKEQYPRGHPDVVLGLNSMGWLMVERGEYGKAEPYLRDALAMCRRLYPEGKYPHGQPDFAMVLDNLGSVLETKEAYSEAEKLRRESLAQYRKLYPKEDYPQGHPDLVVSLTNLSSTLQAEKNYEAAESCAREALTISRLLYPEAKYPVGHPNLALAVNRLSLLLETEGKGDEAVPLCREAVAMERRLYPRAAYPNGHPDLAARLSNLGGVLLGGGKAAEAADVLAEGVAMYQDLAAVYADAASEAEALNYLSKLPYTGDLLLGALARRPGDFAAEGYRAFWRRKGLIARALQGRRRWLARARDDATRGKLDTLLETRKQLADFLLTPGAASPRRAERLQQLNDQKESLEKELARAVPELVRASGARDRSFVDLADRLPDRAAFIDLYRYARIKEDLKSAEIDYTAFVLRKGEPVQRVELGDASAIRKDLKQWRQDVENRLNSDAAGRLRRAVWEPLAKALGNRINVVYVCPEGDVAALPWPALPAAEPGRVLLEDYAFAVVPSGPFLLEQLTQPTDPKREAGALLAVGGVAYDRGDKVGRPWPPLPAADKERQDVVKDATERPQIAKVVERSGADATVARLVQDLPKARWAHLATHGFFAAPDSKEREHLFRPDDFLMGVGSERRGAAARNPLTLSGLVLAGANQPTDADAGILTGEAVAGLNLDGMDLAVLSACQTGLGEAATGEGVFGLQRAFHIGGARNIVASLWKVNDEATAALMNQFYYYLWVKGESPLEALHHAQLNLYRHPQAMPALAKRGAIDFDETATKAPVDAKETPTRTAAVKDWAAFVLSGAGR